MLLRQIPEKINISRGVNIHADVDVHLGDGGRQELDASIELVGHFAVSGQSRDEFYKKLAALIDEYRI